MHARAHEPKAIWEAPRGGHTGALQAMPRAYERRVVGFFDRSCYERAVDEPQWWTFRPVRSLKPASYRCPFCGRLLHATSDHLLIAPEGDTSRRRHAHTECVKSARDAGRFPTHDDWRATQPRTGLLARLVGRPWRS